MSQEKGGKGHDGNNGSDYESNRGSDHRNHEREKSATRKADHLDLALTSGQAAGPFSRMASDQRFFYEPALGGHLPFEEYPKYLGCRCFNKTMDAPIWVSSMTGGAQSARHINRNLAQVVKEFGLGMGLGSCRPLLDSELYWDDFNLRPILGDDRPFFANLGIAQVGSLLAKRQLTKIKQLVEKLSADGLIVHINPLQEAVQPEGDRWEVPPVRIIEELVGQVNFPVLVKEVGQGMGPQSLRALLDLPLGAIELAAFGGTNFVRLELQRHELPFVAEDFTPLTQVGHRAEEMVRWLLQAAAAPTRRCSQIIVSGGINSFLDGHYLCHQLANSGYQALYGQARALLTYSQQEYLHLQGYLQRQITGLLLARAFLTVKTLDEVTGRASP